MPAVIKRLLTLIVLTVIAVSVGLGAAGAWSVWYRSTGFREQFQPSAKPQKANYVPTSVDIISIRGSEPDVETRDKAALLSNPVPATNESINGGKRLYEIYCSPCHGKNGEGMGIMGAVPYLARAPQAENDSLAQYLSGYLGYKPGVDLSFVQEEADSQVYYSITNGGEAIMPGFADALSPTERWDVINYIKRGLGVGIH